MRRCVMCSELEIRDARSEMWQGVAEPRWLRGKIEPIPGTSDGRCEERKAVIEV